MVAFLANRGVGTTSLILKLVANKFYDSVPAQNKDDFELYTSTKPVLHLTLRDPVVKGDGVEGMRNASIIFLQFAVVIVLLYAEDDRSSFESLAAWVKWVRKVNDTACIGIASTKCDYKPAVVPKEEGENKAHELGIPFLGRTSAKDGSHVKEFLENVVSKISLPPQPTPRPLPFPVPLNTKSGCC